MQVCMNGYMCLYISIYIAIHIYVYIYGNPAKNYRPSFFIINTVSTQLFRKVRILYLSRTTEIKLTVSRERVSQLIQVRREHAVNGYTVLFHVGST